MSKNGELFLSQVRDAQQLNMGILTMPAYRRASLDAQTANSLGWDTFKHRIDSIGALAIGNQGTECIITPKNIGWTMQDVTLFVGHSSKNIHELSDLDIDDGKDFLNVNFILAEELLKDAQEDLVQVSIGFNPYDFSAGHHTVAKLHSHVRSVPHAADFERRQMVKWHEMRRFDRLAFIEPFAPLYYDFITMAMRGGTLHNHIAGRAKSKLGYTSIPLKRRADTGPVFADLSYLYSEMRREYEDIAAIFTDGNRDPSTNRFLPRHTAERTARLDKFLSNRSFYSDSSIKALRYLAQNIRTAIPRSPKDPFDMSSTGMIYITRGFAGAMTFNFGRYEKDVVLDFFPRVINALC